MKLTIFFLLFTLTTYGQVGLGTVSGHLVNEKGEDAPLIKIIIRPEDSPDSHLTGGMYSDFDGNFRIPNLEEGSYTIEIVDDLCPSMDTIRMVGVDIKANEITLLGEIKVTYQDEIIECKTLEMRPPPIKTELDPFGRSTTIKEEDIKRH